MPNQNMVDVELDLPEDLSRQVEKYASAHNMTPDEAVSDIVCKMLKAGYGNG